MLDKDRKKPDLDIHDWLYAPRFDEDRDWIDPGRV